ncbi:hypothetical protein AX16_006855 [Volvariella volvacea WC 439]|nr:hypothetical protein AX16_006855 [Volvariella volvacea WC 439]
MKRYLHPANPLSQPRARSHSPGAAGQVASTSNQRYHPYNPAGEPNSINQRPNLPDPLSAVSYNPNSLLTNNLTQPDGMTDLDPNTSTQPYGSHVERPDLSYRPSHTPNHSISTVDRHSDTIALGVQSSPGPSTADDHSQSSGASHGQSGAHIEAHYSRQPLHAHDDSARTSNQPSEISQPYSIASQPSAALATLVTTTNHRDTDSQMLDAVDQHPRYFSNQSLEAFQQSSRASGQPYNAANHLYQPSNTNDQHVDTCNRPLTAHSEPTSAGPVHALNHPFDTGATSQPIGMAMQPSSSGSLNQLHHSLYQPVPSLGSQGVYSQLQFLPSLGYTLADGQFQQLPQNTFQNAHINNTSGKIVNNFGTGNTIHHYQANLNQKMLDELNKLVVHDAMHTGNVRGDDESLGCDPDTRQEIVENLISWISSPNRSHSILWLKGPAGIGKSAIAKTTADTLEDQPRAIVAGSFFFFQNDPHRNNLKGLIPTLVHRLRISLAEVGKQIDMAISTNPGILHMSLEEQWKRLIIQPVKAISSIPPSVFIIDGLDECGSPKDQRRLLQLVASCGPQFPICILICSRPESHITKSFQENLLSSLCCPDIDLAMYKSDEEMKRFITKGFSEIYTRHQTILQDYAIDENWPSDEIIDCIVKQADGQYIYSVTLLRYIDSDDQDPQKCLEECLKQSSTALSPIDLLYMHIMNSAHQIQDFETIQNLLFLIVSPSLISVKSKLLPSINNLAIALSISPSDCHLKLQRLHSVIQVKKKNEMGISVYHKSFIDFLLNVEHSNNYYINQKIYGAKMIEKSISQLRETLFATSSMVDSQAIMIILKVWWGCSTLLDYQDISAKLLLQMESISLQNILPVLPISQNTNIHTFEILYKPFAKKCESWITNGTKDIKYSQQWRDSLLVEQYSTITMTQGLQALNWKKAFCELDKQCNANKNATCPLSWDTFLLISQYVKLDFEYEIAAAFTNENLWKEL